MSIDTAEAQKIYLQAMGALLSVISDDDATDAQQKAAQAGVLTLSHDFRNVNINDVSLRTQQILHFIEAMQAVIAKAQGATLLDGIKTLTSIVKATSDKLEPAGGANG